MVRNLLCGLGFIAGLIIMLGEDNPYKEMDAEFWIVKLVGFALVVICSIAMRDKNKEEANDE